jgi:outer membrane protein assembly factor BamB
LWKFKTGGKIRAEIAIDEISQNAFCCSFDGFAYCLGMDGKLSWKKHLGRRLSRKPELSPRSIFVLSDIDILFKLDTSNGNILWFFESKNKIKNFEIHKDCIYVSCANGFLYVLDNVSGTNRVAVKVSDEIDGVKVTEGHVYIFGHNGNHSFKI